MMNILALETTGKYGSAAVINAEGKVFSAVSAEEMNHLKGMIDLVDEAIKSAGIAKSGLTHVAASVGPGSFTGISHYSARHGADARPSMRRRVVS